MKYYLLLLAFVLTATLNAQNITGRVIDAQTGAPVASAHISIVQTGLGTISNQEGFFSIKLPELKEMIRLNISHIAYASQEVQVTLEGALEVSLEPDFTSLDEVVVKSSAGTMAKDIYKKLKGAADQSQFGRAFYRQISMKDTLPTEWVESFINLSYAPTGLHEMAVQQARVAETRSRNKEDFHLSFVNFTYLSFIPLYRGEVSAVATPFSTFFDQYNFYIEEEYLKGNDTVVKLMFNPDDAVDAYAKAYGWVLYNQSQQKLLQMTLIMDTDLGMQIDDSNLEVEAYLKDSQYQFEFEFNPTGDNLPEVVKVSYTAAMQYGEQLSDMTTQSTLIVHEPETKKHRKLYKPSIDTNFYKEFREAKYRPAFWRENPVIQRTAEEERIIQTLEAAGAFGTYFKGKR